MTIILSAGLFLRSGLPDPFLLPTYTVETSMLGITLSLTSRLTSQQCLEDMKIRSVSTEAYLL